MLLLFQVQIEVSGMVAALIAIGAAIVGFIVGYVYLKSGIEQKAAEGYKRLFELEEKRASKYESLYNQSREEALASQLDYDNLSLEYSQLSELFSKKSLILEAFTGQYGSVAKAIEQLAAEGRLTLPRKMLEAELHTTNGG